MAIENGLYVDKPLTRRASINAFTVPIGAPLQIAPASAKRVRIHFISVGTNVVILTQNSGGSLPNLIQLPTTEPQLILDKDDYGSVVQAPWFAQAVTAPVTVSVIEVVED